VRNIRVCTHFYTNFKNLLSKNKLMITVEVDIFMPIKIDIQFLYHIVMSYEFVKMEA